MQKGILKEVDLFRRIKRAVMGCVLVLAVFTSSIAFSGCNLNGNSQSQSQQQEQSNNGSSDSGQSNIGGDSSEIEQPKEDEVMGPDAMILVF